MKVRCIIFIENLTYRFIPKSGRKYSHTNSYDSAVTVIVQDDHLTAGAWAACAVSRELTVINKLIISPDNCILYHQSPPRKGGINL